MSRKVRENKEKKMKTKMLFCMFIVTSCLFSTIINIPADLPTIQDGIELSANTDTILVAEGTYFENIDFIGKAVTVASNFIIDGDPLHIENTIINGSQPTNPDFGSCVRFMSGEDTTSVITGFTISEGSGCFLSPPDANVGGGILCLNSSSKIVSNIVTNNNTPYGGGIVIRGECSPILMNNVICYNTATINTGGLTVINGTETSLTTVENCQIYENTAGSSGGGLYVGNNSNASLLYTSIYNNSANWGGGISVWNNSQIDLLNTSIYGNSASVDGGGIDVYINCDVNLSYTSIYGNSASVDGGGIMIQNSTPVIKNCTIYDNEALNCGSQIDCWSGGLEAVNSIIGGNSTNGSVYFNIVEPTFDYFDFYNSDGPDFDGPSIPTTLGVVTTFNNNGFPCDEFMNIFSDPLFVDPSNNDFHLSEGSPCIDAGDPNSPPDPDGTIADMGRFYYEQTEINENTVVPTTDYLHQNYPNPFNPTTTITFSLTAKNAKNAKLVIYNLKGQKVKTFSITPRPSTTLRMTQAGSNQYSVVWNGDDDSGNPVSSGIYFYKLRSKNFEQTKKMILMK